VGVRGQNSALEGIGMKRLDRYDWKAIEAALDREGQAGLPGLISGSECDALLDFDAADRGAEGPGNLWALMLGETWLKRPANVPALDELRAELYSRLVPIANRWIERMGIPAKDPLQRYPERLPKLRQICRWAGQNSAQSSVSRLMEGHYEPLGQHADGACVFPLQVTVLLTKPGRDFMGGELVMTEQRPRMQTRPMVVPLGRGDATVFAVSHRPVTGSKGIYRVNLRHAVSPVLRGTRTALNLVFHHAP
jgi:hypothetical protein